MCLCNLLKYKKKNNKECEVFFFQNVDQKNFGRDQAIETRGQFLEYTC